jgi:hypothetical protein
MPAPDGLTWRSMVTAPRDGTHILIAFGQDWTSSAVYVQADGDDFPWKFIDSQGEGRPFLNGARDDECGPSGWMPLPKWAPIHISQDVEPLSGSDMLAIIDARAKAAADNAHDSHVMGRYENAMAYDRVEAELDVVAGQIRSLIEREED